MLNSLWSHSHSIGLRRAILTPGASFSRLHLRCYAAMDGAEAPKQYTKKPKRLPIDPEALVVMEKMPVIKAEMRTKQETGSSYSYKLREKGRMPSALHGLGDDLTRTKIFLTLDFLEFNRYYKRLGPMLRNTLFTLDYGERKELAFVNQLQVHPVRGQPIHVSFVRFNKSKPVKIPVKLMNEDACPAIKRGGFVHYIRTHISCQVEGYEIPPVLNYDVAGMQIGEKLFVKDLKLPEHVKVIEKEMDMLVGNIAGSRRLREDEAAAAAGKKD